MNDLERELRSALDREAGDAPSPHDAHASVRRARRRQIGTVAMSGLGVAAAVLVAVVGVRALGDRSEEAIPASTTDTMNGITITFPDDWALIDPDTAGLNGPDPTPDVPRLILALAPFDPGELFACPGMSEEGAHTFLMTIQQQPLAISGDAARPWPVELEPFGADAAESGCYPGWEFLRAGWTAAGRTFEARVGFAPDVTGADRDALLAAFETMTFDPAEDGPLAAVLETGETGGETWQLIASRDAGGLVLSLETEDSGSGIAGFSTDDPNLQFAEAVVGSGNGARNFVFGAVPPGTSAIECPDPAAIRTFDVPDAIDDRLEAFIVILDVGLEVELRAVDEDGNVIASGVAGSGEGEPIDTPPPAENTALEDGRHFGFVQAVDVEARTIEFDLAYFLTGEEANEAYQEATGETGPVPNDYYVVNENPRLRTLPLSPDLRLILVDWANCCEQTIEGDLEPFATAIEEREDVFVGDVIYRGNSSWWITVQDGVVTRIEEQYTP
jgi:hypothetical protein